MRNDIFSDPEIRKHTMIQFTRTIVGTGRIIKRGWKIGRCEFCERLWLLRFYRRNSAYEDDEKNWIWSCKECYRQDWHYLQEMWEDYWAMRL